MLYLSVIPILIYFAVPIFLVYAVVKTLKANKLRNEYLKEINERLKKLTSN